MQYVRIDGHGSQIVIFLHGFMSTKRYWRRAIKQLDLTECTAVSIDLLGFGKAPKPDSNYGYDEHVAHVRNTISELGFDKSQIIITGHSMGALIASRYANTYPGHVKSVGLINPPIYVDSNQAKKTLLSTGQHYRFLLLSKYRGLLWATGRYIRLFPSHSAMSREKSLESIVIKAEFLDDVRQLSMRSLLTIGLKDRWLYQANIEQARINDISVDVRIDNTGHHAAVTHPLLVAGYIRSLFAHT